MKRIEESWWQKMGIIIIQFQTLCSRTKKWRGSRLLWCVLSAYIILIKSITSRGESKSRKLELGERREGKELSSLSRDHLAVSVFDHFLCLYVPFFLEHAHIFVLSLIAVMQGGWCMGSSSSFSPLGLHAFTLTDDPLIYNRVRDTKARIISIEQ